MWSRRVKSILEGLYVRGKGGMKYCRRRIPAAVRAVCPKQQTHIVFSLGTSDLQEAKRRLKSEILCINAEFDAVAQTLRAYFKMRGYIPSYSPILRAISVILKWPLRKKTQSLQSACKFSRMCMSAETAGGDCVASSGWAN